MWTLRVSGLHYSLVVKVAYTSFPAPWFARQAIGLRHTRILLSTILLAGASAALLNLRFT